jgi:RNA polymerase sigma-70 factor (ECF subfamily)
LEYRGVGEAEDVVQEAYIAAFANLKSLRGDSALSTWLTRITVNEALGRLRKSKRAEEIGIPIRPPAEAEIIPIPSSSDGIDPEWTMAQRQILHLVEQATDNPPDAFRTAFVARVIEGMSLEETAELLEIRPETRRRDFMGRASFFGRSWMPQAAQSFSMHFLLRVAAANG